MAANVAVVWGGAGRGSGLRSSTRREAGSEGGRFGVEVSKARSWPLCHFQELGLSLLCVTGRH